MLCLGEFEAVGNSSDVLTCRAVFASRSCTDDTARSSLLATPRSHADNAGDEPV